jgi:hypothetical protein
LRKTFSWLGWFVLALILLEIGLRLGHIEYHRGGRDLLFTWDPGTGVAPRQGAQGQWHTAEYEVPVRINSQGLRDREHAVQKPANTFRIAVLGDSYTEALQVPMEKDYSSVLERELSSCPALAGHTVEVMNFGVNGFATAQELLRLRSRVWPYAPDLVVLSFDTGNNVFKNSRALIQDPYRPYFVEKDAGLVLDDSFVHAPGVRVLWLFNGLTSWSIQHSRILQLVAATTNYLRRGNIEGLTPTGMGLTRALYRDPEDPEWRDAWHVSEDLIAETDKEVLARGAKFLLVTLSSSIQAEPDPVQRQQVMNRMGITDLFYPDRRIQQFATANGIPVLTLAPYLQKYAQDNQVHLHGQRSADTEGLLQQGLLNELGHKLVGQLIGQKVCSMLPATSGASRAISIPQGARHPDHGQATM